MIIPVKVDRGYDEGEKGAATLEVNGSSSDVWGEQKKLQTGDDRKCNGMSVQQWSMVELQGELISKEPLSGQPLGRMSVENGKHVLTINNHKLEGKVASEPKPLLVLRKVTFPPRGGSRGGGGRRGGWGIRPHRVEYRVVGKITGKTIFKTRPKPLIRKLGGGSSATSR